MEPNDTPTSEEVAPETPASAPETPAAPAKVDAAPAIEKPAPLDAKAREERLAKLPDLLKEAFDGDDLAEDELDEVLVGLTADKLRTVPAEQRVILRAIARRDAAAAEARAAEKAKSDAAIAAAEKKIEEARADLRRREHAMLSVATAATPKVGDAPEVDPFTPEGARALAEYHAKKAQAEANAPLVAEKRRLENEERWLQLRKTYPDLANADVEADFLKQLAEANAGLDEAQLRAGTIQPRMTTAAFARQYFNEREISRLRAEAAAAERRRASDRAESARAMGRAGSGAGALDEVAKYRHLRKTQGEDAAFTYLETNPKAREAVLASRGLT